MASTARRACLAGGFLVAAVCGRVPIAAAQTPADPAAEVSSQADSSEGFVTSTVAEAWTRWHAAMRALLAKDAAASDKAFAEFLATQPSAFRTALFAERTVRQTAEGGAILLLEQDAEAGALSDSGKKVAELISIGREQMNQADDGWYFASVGRFDVAAANFRALVDSRPDPVALLEFADRVPRRAEILIQLSGHPEMGPSVAAILRLLARGETLIKSDPARIRDHIERLAGPPRGYETALEHLKESGEYAIPFMLEYLRNPAKTHLIQPILRALPLIDRAALNPLVQALSLNDASTLQYVVRSLGRIPYPQALPYLLKLRDNPKSAPDVKRAVNDALADLRSRGIDLDHNVTAARLFIDLAEAYYDNRASLAADTTLDEANVWYSRDDILVNIPVPTPIFNEIMCMRCCEEALRLDPSADQALSLWLAANFRREAQLAEGLSDKTRPDNYPAAAYFAQSGGARYCLQALARAVDDADPAVALGAIDALHKTAGSASLTASDGDRVPLADALLFPQRLVRIRAGLALAAADPRQGFKGDQNLAPVLAEALMLHSGARNALVVDPDSSSANSAAAALRSEGFTVLTDSSLFGGLDKARTQMPGVDLLLLASDVVDPALQPGLTRLRDEFTFRAVPVVIIAKPADRGLVRKLVRADHRLSQVVPNDSPESVIAAVNAATHATGGPLIGPELGAALAQEAADALRMLAATHNPVVDLRRVEPALVAAIGSTKDPLLRVTIGQILGYLGTPAAQEAIARIALDPAEPEDARVAMFTALAEAAKRGSSQLGEASVATLIDIAEKDENLTIRTAASRALGALNLPSNKAGDIIRNQYRG